MILQLVPADNSTITKDNMYIYFSQFEGDFIISKYLEYNKNASLSLGYTQGFRITDNPLTFIIDILTSIEFREYVGNKYSRQTNDMKISNIKLDNNINLLIALRETVDEEDLKIILWNTHISNVDYKPSLISKLYPAKI